MPRARNLFRYAQIKIKLKANSVTSPESDVSGTHTHWLTVRMKWICDRDFWHCAANPGRDLLTLSLSHTHSHSVSHSVCLSAYLLTKELSLCLSGWIVLNGDFLCNHLIIHQFPKKPQRGCISTLCWRAQQWETGGRRRERRRREGGRWVPRGNDQNRF